MLNQMVRIALCFGEKTEQLKVCARQYGRILCHTWD